VLHPIERIWLTAFDGEMLDSPAEFSGEFQKFGLESRF
jgi:hypothetical protein